MYIEVRVKWGEIMSDIFHVLFRCLFIVSKALLISSVTVIIIAGLAIWLTHLLRCCLLCVVPSL